MTPLEISKHLLEWGHAQPESGAQGSCGHSMSSKLQLSESGKVGQFYTFILAIPEAGLRTYEWFHKKIKTSYS